MTYRAALLAGILLAIGSAARAQTPPAPHAAKKFEVLDNSFLVEEAFNQERNVFQNIFVWTVARDGDWDGSFTQEWPLWTVKHQFSYTIPFARETGRAGISDVLLNYRYQLLEEGPGRPAIAPRISLVVPTGSASNGFGDGAAGLQGNLAVGKQFGDLYLHANAGLTWHPRIALADRAGRVSLTAPQFAGSGIWRVSPMFNLMLESVVLFAKSVEDGTHVADERIVTISPGFRQGWNFGDRQVVVGAAVPVSHGAGRWRAALLTYFSYELPFAK